MIRKNKKIKQKDLAYQRLKILIGLALKKYKEDYQFAINCIRIAIRIKRKFNLRLPENLRKLYCKSCFNLLIPPHGVKIRVHGKGAKIKIVKICTNCGRVIREEKEKISYPYINGKNKSIYI
jgi:ribonuclease P protein subunit RPR2